MRYPWTRIARPGGPLLRTETGDGEPDLGVLRILSVGPLGHPARDISWLDLISAARLPNSSTPKRSVCRCRSHARNIPAGNRRLRWRRWPKDPGGRRVSVRRRRIQLGHTAGTQKPHRRLPRRVVLAPRCDRDYSGGRLSGSLKLRLAQHPLRNGDGRDLEYAHRGFDRAGLTRPAHRLTAEGFLWKKPVRDLRRRSRLVDAGGEGRNGAQGGAAIRPEACAANQWKNRPAPIVRHAARLHCALEGRGTGSPNSLP